MAALPRRSRSLVPVIAVLGVALVALVVVLLTRGDDRPPTRTTGASATTTSRASAGPTRTNPNGKTTPASAATDRRAVTAAWPRHGASARNARIPILMYHLIAKAPSGTTYPDLWVAPDRFQEQIAALADAGFTAITMRELWDAWHGTGRLPARPIVLSFDDGDITHALNAAPVLLKRRWPGVLNLAVNHLGNGGLPRWGARRLLRQGWEVDSHTTDHLDLTTLDAAGLSRELAGSRRLIRRKLGVDTKFLCYPAGRNDATVRAAAKQAGYVAATTVEPGIAARTDDPFLLPRIRVEPTTTGAGLVSLARGDA